MKKFELQQTEVYSYTIHYCDDCEIGECHQYKDLKSYEELKPVPPDNDDTWELVSSILFQDVILYHWQREKVSINEEV